MLRKIPSRLGNYFKSRSIALFNDYKFVFTECCKDMPKHPFKWTKRLALTTFIIASANSVPSFDAYFAQLKTAKLDMAAAGCLRNPAANKRLQELLQLETRNLLNYENRWFFSVIRKVDYSNKCCIAEAAHDKLKARWYNPLTYAFSIPRYFKSVVDVGIFGTYLGIPIFMGVLPDVDLITPLSVSTSPNSETFVKPVIDTNRLF